ncbi:hypothetical protein KC878_03580 [Candidatus Saccharibacteria bacterium]|nr:hypothetical protein [Candidatus Saccharibacteria bacterium]
MKKFERATLSERLGVAAHNFGHMIMGCLESTAEVPGQPPMSPRTLGSRGLMALGMPLNRSQRRGNPQTTLRTTVRTTNATKPLNTNNY